VQCGYCGVRFLNPRPTPQEYAQIYAEEYFTGAERYADYVAGKESDFVAQYQALERFPRTGNRLLEVGSAMGHFLNVGVKRGWNVIGIELSEWAARYCRKQFGVDVIIGRFEDMTLPPNMFDVVVMSHVLEHLESPRGGLSKARVGLKEGGLLMAEVPNQFDELYARVALPWIMFRARKREPLIVHTFFFTPAQFVRLVKSCGFKVLHKTTMRRTYPPMESRLPGGKQVRKAFHMLGGFINKGPIVSVIARKIA